MNLTHLLSAVAFITPDALNYYDERLMACLDDCNDSHTWVSWDEVAMQPLTRRDFYKQTDVHDKYGQIYGIIYFNDQPALMISQSGRYLVNHSKVVIDPVVANAMQQWLNEQAIRIERENGTYFEPSTIDDWLAVDEIRNLDLTALPVLKRDMYSPRDAILDMTNALFNQDKE